MWCLFLLVGLALATQVADAHRFRGSGEEGRRPERFWPGHGRWPGRGPFRPPVFSPVRPPTFGGNLERVLTQICSNGSLTTEARAQAATCSRCFSDALVVRRIWGQAPRTPDYEAARQCFDNVPQYLAICRDILQEGTTTNFNTISSQFNLCLLSLSIANRMSRCIGSRNFDQCLFTGISSGTNENLVTATPTSPESGSASPRPAEQTSANTVSETTEITTSANTVTQNPEETSANTVSGTPEETSANTVSGTPQETSANTVTQTPEETSANTVTQTPEETTSANIVSETPAETSANTVSGTPDESSTSSVSEVTGPIAVTATVG